MSAPREAPQQLPTSPIPASLGFVVQMLEGIRETSQ